MAESDPKSLIEFEWDLIDDESPETAVKPPDDLPEPPEKLPASEAEEDDDWP